MTKKVEPIWVVFGILGGVILLFIIAPLLNMFLSCSAPELKQAIEDTVVLDSIWLTLFTSMAATVVAGAAAIPLAYVLARKNFVFKRAINGIIMLPVVIPHSAAGIALFGVLSKNSFVGKILSKMEISFVDSAAGVAAAMAFVSVPFLINAAREGFAAVPARLEMAALNLGAGPLRVFFTISVPLAWRAILSGLVLMWARGMSEFGAVIIIAYHPKTTPVLIYERFGAFGLKYARPVAVVFVAVCLVFFVAVRLLAKEEKHAQR